MRLPDEPHCDELEGELGRLQDAIDGVHVILYRAGLARTHASGAESPEMREAHLERLGPLGERWPDALRELQLELNRAVRWVGEELQPTP